MKLIWKQEKWLIDNQCKYVFAYIYNHSHNEKHYYNFWYSYTKYEDILDWINQK